MYHTECINFGRYFEYAELSNSIISIKKLDCTIDNDMAYPTRNLVTNIMIVFALSSSHLSKESWLSKLFWGLGRLLQFTVIVSVVVLEILLLMDWFVSPFSLWNSQFLSFFVPIFLPVSTSYLLEIHHKSTQCDLKVLMIIILILQLWLWYNDNYSLCKNKFALIQLHI